MRMSATTSGSSDDDSENESMVSSSPTPPNSPTYSSLYEILDRALTQSDAATSTRPLFLAFLQSNGEALQQLLHYDPRWASAFSASDEFKAMCVLTR